MSALDKALILRCAFACEAAYEEDHAARFALLEASGLVEIAYVQGSGDARALLCNPKADPAQIILAFQGTQFTRWELASIFANFECETVDLGGGRLVHAGYLGQVQSLMAQLAVLAAPRIVTGHSMGGAMAELYANLDNAPAVTLLTFGAPKCANILFWNVAKNVPVRIVNERDPAPLWPPFDGITQPGDIEWLHRETAQSSLTELRNPPVNSDVVGDHFLEAYVPNLEVLS